MAGKKEEKKRQIWMVMVKSLIETRQEVVKNYDRPRPEKTKKKNINLHTRSTYTIFDEFLCVYSWTNIPEVC